MNGSRNMNSQDKEYALNFRDSLRLEQYRVYLVENPPTLLPQLCDEAREAKRRGVVLLFALYRLMLVRDADGFGLVHPARPASGATGATAS